MDMLIWNHKHKNSIKVSHDSNMITKVEEVSEHGRQEWQIISGT